MSDKSEILLIKNIQMFTDCDVYIMKNEVEHLGFDKNKSFGEIVDLAILHKCTVITKNGSGKWYLKGQEKKYAETLVKIQANAGVGKFPRIKCWLIEYSPEDDL
jgi:hypothetical protein